VGFEQMLRRRQINRDPRGRSVRFLGGIVDVARRPFERAAWAVERGVLWPLQERLAGWSPPAPRAGAVALGAIVVAAALASVLLLSGGEPTRRDQIAETTRVTIATPDPQPSETPDGPLLHGASPDFSTGGIQAGQAGGAGAELNAGSSTTEPAAGDEASAAEEGGAATTSSKKPVPAGPAAMKVARRFSEAFVFYEVGEKPARAKTIFSETATPELATALGERPPRQPADTEVPKAKVLNLVPGPRAGKAYTVSVSLLRIGLTSELRLELNKQKGQWLITDVRG
jgi:hypothetical protein